MRARRTGAALLAAVVLSLAGVLLAHAVLVLTGSDVRASATSARVLQAEHAAKIGARAAFRHVSTEDSVVVSGRATTGGGGVFLWQGRVGVLSEEVLWITGEGRAGQARRAGGFAAWRLSPRTRVRSLEAALVTGGASPVSGAAGVSASASAGASAVPTDETCPLDTFYSAGSDGLAAWAIDVDSVAPSLGRLDLGELDRRSELRVSGSVVPGPRIHAGQCVEDPWNWGDPGRSGAACDGRMPLVSAASGTVIEGGVGQGVLLVQGDLTIRDTELRGLLLIDGRLRMEGQARVVGAVHARGGATLESSATIIGSGCWVEAVLNTATLRRPVAIEPIRWIRLDG